MALVKSVLYVGEKPTATAIAEAEAAAKSAIAFDEDCPPTTESELAMLDALIAKRVSKWRRSRFLQLGTRNFEL